MRYPSECTMGDKELEKLMNGKCPHETSPKRENGRLVTPLEPGTYVRVRRPGQPALSAEVLRVRLDRARRHSDYYVHYVDCDRRLDEWVSGHRVTPENGPRALRRKTASSPAPTSLYYERADPAAALRRMPVVPRVKRIHKIQLGRYEIDTWYFSPYPEEYGKRAHLYVCEFCLGYMKLERSYRFHLVSCRWRRPRGRQIYRKDSVALYEACGRDDKYYCQNLCLLAKLFLDHKTLYYDIEQFLFYVLCEVDAGGARPVGYFSKERDSREGYNVACILTLPPYQRRGYGKLLIALSYELSKRERKPGTPEKPLSDLGMRSYRSYWCYVLLSLLDATDRSSVTVKELCLLTGISRSDVVNTLDYLHLLKYWKSDEVVLVNRQGVRALKRTNHYKVPGLLVDPAAVRWAPPRRHAVRLRRTTS